MGFAPDVGRFAALALALLGDALLGETPFRHVPHPIALLGRAIAVLERRLNRGGVRRRRIGGLMTVVVVAGGATLVSLLPVLLPAWVAPGPGWSRLMVRGLLDTALVTVLLAGRDLFNRVSAVATALERDGLSAGCSAVRHIAGRDPRTLDAHGVARTAIESLAENFSDALVAPALWYLLGGLPGVCFYKAVNTLDSMIGYRRPRYQIFGCVAARLDDVVNWLPARLAAGLLLGAAALLPGVNARRGARIVYRDAGRHPSPNAGWPEGAMAGALGLALGGPRQYPGGLSESAWIGGDGRAAVTPADIRTGLRLYRAAMILFWALSAAAVVILVVTLSW